MEAWKRRIAITSGNFSAETLTDSFLDTQNFQEVIKPNWRSEEVCPIISTASVSYNSYIQWLTNVLEHATRLQSKIHNNSTTHCSPLILFEIGRAHV